ncbi:MAG TPA: hypothetical protein PLR25_24060 [Planctomycetaceae bacterium]|nr:hypothetical protein [Planctomycetaceae bacterium]
MSEIDASTAPDETRSKPSLATIDRLVFQLLPRGYAWPASALTGWDLQRLNEIRNATRKPITQLLQDAVDLLYEATAAERAVVAQQQTATKQRVRRSVSRDGNYATSERQLSLDFQRDEVAEPLSCDEETAGESHTS